VIYKSVCGICSVFDVIEQIVSKESIEKMLSVMKHRGPDDEGLFIDANIGLGHIRLCIVDLFPSGYKHMFDLGA